MATKFGVWTHFNKILNKRLLTATTRTWDYTRNINTTDGLWELDMYWSLDPLLRVPAVADVMGKNRYQKINQYFHMNDNSDALPKTDPNYDPLFKVRPLLDLIKSRRHMHHNPGCEISIDEAMIKFNGRLEF
ncbi:hypothetical protein LSH36_193g05000 [Paralvinella palmiformis]|uniref:PiggyBac transposable element-derived protein domain-containing protein n=1 Tax=Paralvinella palmiformis TaxID=53620 RepID=A0AAD9N6J2_9ANNE|nr:hypothetical protein LSH36_193g05000 [Paralvinella palmiformis]